VSLLTTGNIASIFKAEEYAKQGTIKKPATAESLG
jgi:hypothetical protein